MSGLEKFIQYADAVLEPGDELEVFDGGNKIRLKPIPGSLCLLCHFDSEIGANLFSGVKEEISQGKGIGYGTVYFDTGIISPPKFGNASYFQYGLIGGGGVMFAPEVLFNADRLTIDYWYKTDSGVCVNEIVSRWGVQNIWSLWHDTTHLRFSIVTSDGEFNFIALDTVIPGEWHHHRVSFNVQTGAVKMFVDGIRVGFEDVFTGALLPENSSEQNQQWILALNNPNAFRASWLDELRIFKEYMPDEFTPPTEATKPFSQNTPRAKLSLDSGFNNARWFLSELGFLDETDFLNQGLKLRIDSDNDNSPNFTGDLLSLDYVRGMPPRVGRYLHLEFSFISDGDTQRVLYPGRIVVKPQSQILIRQEPEILRRF